MPAKILCVVDRQRAVAGTAIVEAVMRVLRMAGLDCSLEIVEHGAPDCAVDASIAGIVAFGEAAADCVRPTLGTIGHIEPIVIAVGEPAIWRGDARAKRASWLGLRGLLRQLRDAARARIGACPGHPRGGA
ncbi:MAG: hypothetical protein WBW61_04645 [Rhodanobacteraceae bacterium]